MYASPFSGIGSVLLLLPSAKLIFRDLWQSIETILCWRSSVRMVMHEFWRENYLQLPGSGVDRYHPLLQIRTICHMLSFLLWFGNLHILLFLTVLEFATQQRVILNCLYLPSAKITGMYHQPHFHFTSFISWIFHSSKFPVLWTEFGWKWILCSKTTPVIKMERKPVKFGGPQS